MNLRRAFNFRKYLQTICPCGLILWLIATIRTNICNIENDGKCLPKPCVKDAKYDFDDYAKVGTPVSLLIVVVSAPANAETRNTIRESWARKLPNGANVKFFIGMKNLLDDIKEKVLAENSTRGDMVLLKDLEESYNGLTKKILSIFQWTNQHVKFSHLMKIDEDSFLRVDKILEELVKKPMTRLYWGFFDGRAHVKKSGKWSEKDYVLCDRYLPYALGGGYVISRDLVAYVATNANLLKLFKSEDVSLGTWLGPLDIIRIHDPNFDTEFKSRGCFNSYIVTHKKSPEELKQLHHNLEYLGHLCETEKRVRLSYKYDWFNLPTKCCQRIDKTIP